MKITVKPPQKPVTRPLAKPASGHPVQGTLLPVVWQPPEEENKPKLITIDGIKLYLKEKLFIRKEIPYAVLEVQPGKRTNNTNVRWLMTEFARLYKPLQARLQLLQEQGAIIYTPEMSVWWEVILKHNQISFYLIVPDVEGLKQGLSRAVMKCWKQANVKEVNDYMPKFDPQHTSISQMTLKYHELLSLDTENPTYTPLESLLNAKHYLTPEDTAMFQIGMEPKDDSWNSAMADIVEEYKETQSLPRKKGKKLTAKETGREVSFWIGDAVETCMNAWSSIWIPEWEETKQVKSSRKGFTGSIDSTSTKYKIRSDAFKTVINLVAECQDPERRRAIVRAMASGFDPLEGDNTLVEAQITKKKALDKKLQDVMLRVIPPRTHDILCTRELAKIVNVPDEKSQIEHYNELSLVSNRGDAEVPREIFIGRDDLNIPFAELQDTDGKWKPIYYDTKNRNLLCMARVLIGEPNTGKTTAGVNMAIEAFMRGYGVVFVDSADGKAIQRIIDRIPSEKRDKVVIIDFANKSRPIGMGWNEPFFGKTADDVEDLLADEVISYIELVSGETLNMTAATWVELAVKAVFRSPDNTIQDVMRMMSDADYRSKILPTITDPELRADWEKYHNDYSKEDRAKICDQAFRRVYKLMRNKTLKAVLLQTPKKDDQGRYLVDFRRWVDEGYCVLIKANETLGEHIVTALVSFVLAKFNMAIISREDIIDEDKRNPCFLILDEPDHYIKGSERWRNMLTRYRKYRCGLTFMFHGWEQLKKTDKDLPSIIRKSGAHYMLFQTDEENLYELQSVIEPEFKVKEVAKGLPQYHAVIRLKLYTKGGDTTPAFMARALNAPENRLPKYDNDDLYEKCAQELGEDKEIVLTDIFKRSGKSEISIADLSLDVDASGEGELRRRKPPQPSEPPRRGPRAPITTGQRNRMRDEISEHMDKMMEKGEIDDSILREAEDLGLLD